MLGLGTGERANGPDYCPVGRRDDPHLRPEARRLLRRSRRPQRADAGVRRVRRLPEVPDAVHLVPDRCSRCSTGSVPVSVISDAGRLTPAQQDRVVDECFQCRLCLANCPYAPGMHELAIDFPRLMARARAMRHADRPADDPNDGGRSTPRPHRPHRQAGDPRRAGDQSVGRRRGRAHFVAGCWPRSPASRRSDAWCPSPGDASRGRCGADRGTSGPALDRRVTVFPTCLVEYRRPEIGHALLDVYAHHGIACDVARIGCCGAPWLTAGDTRKFAAPRGAQRHNARRRDSRRHRRRRRPTDLPRGDHHRLHRPRRRRRRRTGRRQDVRRRRLPGRSRRRSVRAPAARSTPGSPFRRRTASSTTNRAAGWETRTPRRPAACSS